MCFLGCRSSVICACFSFSCLVLSTAVTGQPQVPADHDTSYYESYPERFIGRIYFSGKYTNLELKKDDETPRIRYRPNTSLNTGIGATYRTLSLNIAYGFGFLNNNDEKGKTRRLDLQSRVYSRKWAIDLYGQFFKGFYLYPKGRAITDPDRYYERPDLKINLGGISAYRLLNHKRFSFRSVFVQDERQKKSAGTILVGAEVYYGTIKGDSALVPGDLSSSYDQRGIAKARIMEIGPGAGYAYTQVLPFNLYLMGCIVMNLNMSLVQESGVTAKTDHFGINADMLYRYSVGYNNGNWNVNVFRVSNKVSAKSALSGNRYVFDTGIYRLIIAKRLNPGVRGRKLLKPIDRIMGGR